MSEQKKVWDWTFRLGFGSGTPLHARTTSAYLTGEVLFLPASNLGFPSGSAAKE